MDTVVAGLALAYFFSGARSQDLKALSLQNGGEETAEAKQEAAEAKQEAAETKKKEAAEAKKKEAAKKEANKEGVVDVTKNYDNEGYDSMSLDHNRNLYFIESIKGMKDIIQLINEGKEQPRRRPRSQGTDFLEIGPGADAKLTKMILNDQVGDKPTFMTVTAIESNRRSYEEAKKELDKFNTRRKRATIYHGDANKVLGSQLKESKFACVVMEIIGFVASCEGQCSLLRSVTPHLRDPPLAVPARFGTFLCPFTGKRFDYQVPFRVRNKSADKHLKKSELHLKDCLTVEDWDATNIEQNVQDDSSRVFESTVDLPENSTALVGFIKLRNDHNWCSSGHWTEKNRATNWDLFVIPLPETVTRGSLRLKSTVKAFTTQPEYLLEFSGDEVSFSVGLKFPDMFDTELMPRIG